MMRLTMFVFRVFFAMCILLQIDLCWTYAMDLSGRITKPTCVPIPDRMGLCQNIGYKQMRMPNLLDHDTMEEVQQQAASWVPLLARRCHPDTQLFLCSLFAPVCLDRPIYPCRSLCERVRDSCSPLMAEHGFPWPEMLYCEKLPLDNDLCITPHMSNSTTETGRPGMGGGVVSIGRQIDREDGAGSPGRGRVCEQCRREATQETILDEYCKANFVVKTRMSETKKSRGDRKFVSNEKKRKFYNRGDVRKKDMQDLSFWVEGGGGQCDCDNIQPGKETYLVMGEKKDKKFVITFAMPWKKSRDFRRATRMFKGYQCGERK